ncbi:hypothetical protein EN871_01005 [bacterium M00.F.Ca.ET.228.01.1.1]|uniref:Uncharacterized protein n=1 Tax=Burkholderia sp. (strain CCGE1003) TaxID=640512 RepID=E1TJ05_BURSG|nr:hypothetical protein [Paraburkholderia phenoliruptrix]MBW9132207.1 hypothetical protein [Paraburkholderia ginsengiterrae]TGP47423.1 hypothetical protein EN871_01005 [bacterium M00.F.Ca.ET.228.01.1.1]TGS05215.1 hypothetical protein EN834_01005 [bacterium M00.F.Ca.ET.191.01.1.1]TGU10151.1 hypothetical protein EN798_01005 [bacterium M00.F.Ca.ET.155.01.1.1]MBW0449577.1 hypothetical protein [Paraburkholderia phenoliruptrix]
MSSLIICDLSRTRELDRRAMSAVSGGTGSGVPGVPSVSGLSGIANVNVSVNQNLSQLQYVNVAALNNVGVVGAGIVPLHLNVSPALWASNTAVV